jgi:AAA family ATP:ADP antiporter
MSAAAEQAGQHPGAGYNVFYRFLRLFADVRRGEAPKALLLALNVFLLLLAYYILKPLREALLLVNKDAPVVKSCLGSAQAVLFIVVIKGFSKLASKVSRHTLITWTTLFFISNLVVFYALHAAGMAIKPMGIMFFIWIGIFNMFVVAQFWGFANDLYSDEVGKRTFPLVALGATLGGLAGTRMRWLREAVGVSWEYKLMLIAGAILLLCIGLARTIHAREVRRAEADREKGLDGAEEKARRQTEPLKAGGGFKLIFKSRYLLLMALMVGTYNFVNSTGEYIISAVTVNKVYSQPAPAKIQPAEATPSAGPQAAVRPAQPGAGEQEADPQAKQIHESFMDYQFLTNLIALFIQLFLVSRIFRWAGITGALLFMPLVALGGYGLLSFGAGVVLVKWVKSLENGMDYSLQNTTKAALFLITPREQKYKAKAAIDTFFVRGGDTLSAVAVLVGTAVFGLKIESYAFFNVLGVLVWLGICILIIRQYAKAKAQVEGAGTAA